VFVCLFAGRSVTLVGLAKMAKPIEMPFGLKTGGPMEAWEILRGEEASHCQVLGYSVVVYAKTAEPIEMPFGLRTRVGLGNHVLDGDPDPPWEGAILGERLAHCKYRDFLP